MKTLLIYSLILLILTECSDQSDKQNKIRSLQKDESIRLFSGSNFEGWDVDTNYFVIKDSAVVGGTLDGPNEEMMWMTTKKNYANFILDADVKLLGGNEDENSNGGIYFRCSYDDERMLVGYEADMWINNEEDDSNWWGSLHDPFRRDFDEFNIVGNQDSLIAVYKDGDWNHLKIYCNGPDIKVWLNGFLTAEYTEKDKSIDTTGIIGLQLHDGPPMESWYKNIIIKEL